MRSMTDAESLEPPPSPPGARITTTREIAWVAAAYLLIYICITWPVVLSPQRLVASRQSDGYIDMLMFWYAKEGKLQQPWTHALFYPDGVPLGPEKAQAYLLVPYLSIPLQWFLPLPVVFNFLLAFFFTASGTALHALVRQLGLSASAAFTAGALFVLSPAYLSELSHGIPENLSVQWVLLFILLGLRARETPTRVNIYGSGVCLALAWLTSWYSGAIALVFMPLLPLRRLLPGIVLAILLLLWPMRHALHPSTVDNQGRGFDLALARQVMAEGLKSTPTITGRHLRNTPPAVFEQMASLQVLRNSADLGGWLDRHRAARLRDVLPGVLLVALALLGLLTSPSRAWPWAALALVSLYVSLGPVILWRGDWVVPSPLSWLYEHVPLMARMRPVRFILPTTICLSVLSAYGFPRLTSKAGATVLAMLLIGLSWAEVSWIQVSSYRIVPTDATIPAAYEELGREHAGEGMIDLPILFSDVDGGRHLYYQVAHQRPMLNYDFVALDSLQRLGRRAHDNSLIGALLGEAVPIERADVQRLTDQGFRDLVLHPRVAAPIEFYDRPFLFDGTLYDDLTTIYGPPREVGGLLSFDMQHPRADAWRDGVLRHDVVTQEMPASYGGFVAETGARSQMLLSTPPAPWQELRGWLRGNGVKVRVLQGTRELSASLPLEGDDWTWVRVKLQSPNPDLPVTVWLDIPAASSAFRGALVESLTLWRRASGWGAEAEMPAAR